MKTPSGARAYPRESPSDRFHRKPSRPSPPLHTGVAGCKARHERGECLSEAIRGPEVGERHGVLSFREMHGRAQWSSTAVGAAAASAMALFYIVVVWVASGSIAHLTDQVRADWYILLPIVAGFGAQVGLMVELRHRRQLLRGQIAAGSTGAGVSTVGMVACCAHHLAELLPISGATAAATFLYGSRLPLMVAGLGLNAVALTLAMRRLRSLPSIHQEDTCALDGSLP